MKKLITLSFLFLISNLSLAQDNSQTSSSQPQDSSQISSTVYTPVQYNMNVDSNNINPQNYESTTNNLNTISAPTMIMVSPVMGGTGIAQPVSK